MGIMWGFFNHFSVPLHIDFTYKKIEDKQSTPEVVIKIMSSETNKRLKRAFILF
jgi:hypothetical protein